MAMQPLVIAWTTGEGKSLKKNAETAEQFVAAG